MGYLRSRLIAVQFVLLALTWGASFLFIKVGLEGLAPAQVVLGRLVAGAVTLLVGSLVTRSRLPAPGLVWAHLAVIAVLWCVVPFLLFAWAERHVSSGLASIYNATTPLMTTLVALLALPQERPTPARLTGLVTGFVGVVVVLGPWHGLGGGDALAQAGLLLATACYGTAFVWFRRFVAPYGLPAVTVATGQVTTAAVMVLAISPWVATAPVHLHGRVIASVLALGVLGTGLAYLWNTNVINAWGATNASTVTYLTPAVGVLLGSLLLDETIGWNEPVGTVLVVLGIAISQGRLTRRRTRPGGGHHVSAPATDQAGVA